MPVARKLWQEIFVLMPAVAALDHRVDVLLRQGSEVRGVLRILRSEFPMPEQHPAGMPLRCKELRFIRNSQLYFKSLLCYRSAMLVKTTAFAMLFTALFSSMSASAQN